MSNLTWGEVVRQNRFVETPQGRRRAIIKRVCDEHMITLNVLLGPSRAHHVVRARYEAIKQVHQAFPEIGTSALGRLFKRDHSTIQYALGKLGFRAPKKGRMKCQTGHSESSGSLATT